MTSKLSSAKVRVDEMLQILNYEFPLKPPIPLDIPLEWRPLTSCCRKCRSWLVPMEDMPSPAQRAPPLEIGEIRKTTRRVAALLSQPEVGDFMSRRRPRKAPLFCYTCNKLNPHRHLVLAEGYSSKCPHMPSAPHPSFVNENEIRRDFAFRENIAPVGLPVAEDPREDKAEDRYDGGFNISESSARGEGVGQSPGFSLPPIFNTDRSQHDRRQVPLVSENTLTMSNLKTSATCHDNNATEDNNDEDDSDQAYSDDVAWAKTHHPSSAGHSPLHLPSIPKGRNVLTGTPTLDDADDDITDVQRAPGKNRKPKKDRMALTSREGSKEGEGRNTVSNSMTSRSDRDLQGVTLTFESELTGASLRIDEDYIPMSVTIKRLKESDLDTQGHSDYQDYSDFLSSSPSGSLNVSLDNSFASSGRDSPLAFMARLREASWCECPHDTLTTVQCPECRLAGGKHEKWCVSAGSVCHACQKPIQKLNVHTHRRRSLKAQDFHDIASTPDLSISAMNVSRDLHTGRSCSGTEEEWHRKRGRRKRRSRRSKKDEKMTKETEQRVRFNDTLQMLSPEYQHNLSDTGPNSCGSRTFQHAQDQLHDYLDPAPSVGAEDDPYFTRRPKPQTLDTSLDVRVPRLGLNIHRSAYILALRDARLFGTSEKKKKKGREVSKTTTSGTIFSYFPLLRHPMSEPTKSLNLGLRQDEGVKVKDAMKHIFGNIKHGEYYPGGSKWRKMS